MDLHVSFAGRKGLGREIHDQLRAAIVAGWLRPGDALPPTRALAARLGVSRSTVTLVYERLGAEGLVTARVGAGTFVTEHAVRLLRVLDGEEHPGALRPRPVWEDAPSLALFGRPAEFDLRTGLPDPSFFPRQRWRQLVQRCIRSSGNAVGSYAQAAGLRSLREAIVRHIAVSRGIRTSVDHVTVTNGIQQAIDLVARILLASGDRVAVEDPGYPPPTWLLRRSGMVVRGVPIDEEGLVVSAIPAGSRMVYVTSSHQYPLGVTMSLARRIALLEWAEANDAAIVEDDYDGEFRFRNRPIDPIRTLDGSGRVIYLGTFSKTLSPSLRVGFVVTPPSLTAALRGAKLVADWHTEATVQAALARFLDEGGFSRHLRRVVRKYDRRHEALIRAVTEHLGGHLEVVATNGGLHVAARARKASVEAIAEVVARAAEAGVAVHPLSIFAVEEGGALPGLVMGYGAITAERVPEAVRRLEDCFRRAGLA
jgi:GntR family transcriptional regulator/MocR family aminotransferase